MPPEFTLPRLQAAVPALLAAAHVALAWWVLPELAAVVRYTQPWLDALTLAQAALLAVGLLAFPFSARGIGARCVLVPTMILLVVYMPAGNAVPSVWAQLLVVELAATLLGLTVLWLAGLRLGDPATAQTRPGLQFSLRGLIGAMLASAVLVWGANWLRNAGTNVDQSTDFVFIVTGTTNSLHASPAVIGVVIGTGLGLVALAIAWGCLSGRTVWLRLPMAGLAAPLTAVAICWTFRREGDWMIMLAWFASYATIIAATLLAARFTLWPEWTAEPGGGIGRQPALRVVPERPKYVSPVMRRNS